MKEKISNLFKEKLFLVVLVLGLLTIVSAAGVVTIQKKGQAEKNPYIHIEDPKGLAQNETEENDVEEVETKEAEITQRIEITNPKKEEITEEITEESTKIKEAADLKNAKSLILNFTDAEKLCWPLRGNVLLDYSVDTTIYFPTLDQYKCNKGIVVQGEVSEPVNAPAAARVEEIGYNEEIGNYVVLDLGNDYSAVCGQLKDVKVSENQYLNAGELLGYIAEPTKYYTIEGSNLYFELRNKEKTLDPLDYLQ